MKLKRTKTTIVAAMTALGTLAAAPAASAGNHDSQEADGLVVVQISDTNVNVTVPINAAVGIAANVCDVDLDLAVLGAIDEGTQGSETTTCDAESPVFAGQDLTITNN